MVYKYLARTYVKPDHQGYCAYIPNLTELEHTHDFYEAYLVVSGNATHAINGGQTELVVGSVGLIRPSDLHYFHHRDCKMFNLILSIDMLNQIVDFLGRGSALDDMLIGKFPVQRNLSIESTEALIMIFEQFMLTPHPVALSYNIGLKLVATAVIEKLFYKPEFYDKQNFCPQWLQSLLEKMQKEENYSRGIGAMYEISMYTPEHLCRMFRQYLHMTPTQFLNDIRLKEASKKLIYTDMPILDISESIGFDTPSHFYHLFKAYYNTSPLKYRKDRQLNLIDLT